MKKKEIEIKLINNCFLGVPVPIESIKEGYIDYETLSKTFNCVLCNSITDIDEGIVYEIVNGSIYYDYDEEDSDSYEHKEKEFYQFFIIDERGKDILQKYTDEIILYSNVLKAYFWGITHFGTNWDDIYTDIKIKK